MKLSQRMFYTNEICKFCVLWFSLQVTAVVYPVFAPDRSSDHLFLMAYIPCVVFVFRLQVCGYGGVVALLQFELGQRRQDQEGHRLGRRLTTKTESTVALRSSRSQLVVGCSVILLFRVILRLCCTNLHSLTSNYTQYKNYFWIF